MSKSARCLIKLFALSFLIMLTGCTSTPLIKASLDGDLNEVKKLVAQGNPVNVQDCHTGFDYVCCTPITCAANKNHVDVVKYLHEHGADVNTVDASGHYIGTTKFTPLHYAAYRGNIELTYYLLSKGASISATTSNGWTPLKFAEMRGHTNVKDVLAAELKKKYVQSDRITQPQLASTTTLEQFLPYQTLDVVPQGIATPIDGIWTINQGRMRVEAGRMYFINNVKGVARANMVNIKDIRQTAPRTYSINGFVTYQSKSYYVPGELLVASDKALLLTLYPKPELGLPNGYTEVYTREKLDDDALFAAQLTTITVSTPDKASPLSVPNLNATPDDNAVAIVIGIEKYQSLPSAGFVRSDASLIRDYLKAMGYQERNIEFLTDERATYTGIRKAVETWLPKRINPQSRVTVYYAGHGAPDPQSGDAYIVPYDGDPSYLSDTGYPLKRLYEKLESLPAKQVVVLIDACFSGAGGRGVLAAGARALVRIEKAAPKSNRIAVLTSTQGAQISTSSPEKKQGIFTYFLLKAFQEGNRDLVAVYDYLKPLVENEAKRMNVEQTPSLSPDTENIRGKFNFW